MERNMEESDHLYDLAEDDCFKYWEVRLGRACVPYFSYPTDAICSLDRYRKFAEEGAEKWNLCRVHMCL